jgi:hypothetical protein
VSESFSLKDIKRASLRDTLVANYLGSYAALRSMQVYPDNILPNLDWDGVSAFDSVRLPDEIAYNDIMAYNAKVRSALDEIPDASLSYIEKQLKEYALYDARAHAHGAFSGDGYGGFDMQSPCEGMQRDWDIDSAYQGDKGRPKIFKTNASALIEVNALFSDRVLLRWLDVGTFEGVSSLYRQVPSYTALFNGNSVVHRRLVGRSMPSYMAVYRALRRKQPLYKVSEWTCSPASQTSSMRIESCQRNLRRSARDPGVS